MLFEIRLLLGKEFVAEPLEAPLLAELPQELVDLPPQFFIPLPETHGPWLLLEGFEHGPRLSRMPLVVLVDRHRVVDERIGAALEYLQHGCSLAIEHE